MNPTSDSSAIATITAHRIAAALRAAKLLDAKGSPVGDAHASYALYPSDAAYPPAELHAGVEILLFCGLLTEIDGSLYPAEDLQTMCHADEADALQLMVHRLLQRTVAVSPLPLTLRGQIQQAISDLPTDPDVREAMLLAAGRKFDDADRRALGALGEEFVVELTRKELNDLGRYDLATEVTRVSEFADDLGYDVAAPGLIGRRRMEVKTTSRRDDSLVRFFLTRNEIGWGLRDPGWALVVCDIDGNGDVSLKGYCRAAVLSPYLPQDSDAGSWVTCEIVIPEHLLERGLPSGM